MLDIQQPSSSANPSPAIPLPTRGHYAPFVEREDPYADLDRLGNEIAELAAHIQAATYQLLLLIREFDNRGGWGTGFRSCAHWLNWRTGLDLGASREKVRVAHALEDLPRISRSMRRGELSYSKVRALTRVATPDNEAELLKFALTGTAAHVESLVRAWRRVDRFADLDEGHRIAEHRFLNTFTDEDGMLVVRGRLAPEVGAIFQKALEAAMEALFQQSLSDAGAGAPDADVDADLDAEVEADAPEWSEIPIAQQRADALELIVESALAGDLDPGTVGDRYQVVVHVHEQVATRPHQDSDVSAETSRRLACEASRVIMEHAPDGRVIDVGRKTRAIHPAMRRALNHRDGGCQFPGCNVKHCDAHHVEHWADGGETNLDNLLLLCRFHHRALHEGGFRVVLDADGTSSFYSARGKALPVAPPAPALAREPAVDLTRRNWQAGLEIDGFTGFPSWHGEPINLNYALDGLRDL